jgi:cytolysin (calcineurin-like family phosphatase)
VKRRKLNRERERERERERRKKSHEWLRKEGTECIDKYFQSKFFYKVGKLSNNLELIVNVKIMNVITIFI